MCCKNKYRKNIFEIYFPKKSCVEKTNIGKIFLKSIDSCFPKNHVLRKIINRNTVKISYSCMPNFKQKISNHNLKIQKTEKTGNQIKCVTAQGLWAPAPCRVTA